MCGIVAAYAARDRVAVESVDRATRRLSHRGPDGQRVWISDDSRAALGHARLSIIDLATGDQPIASEDGSLRIVVNGEFYDFESLRRRLERYGHRFRTRSDSEVALHLTRTTATAAWITCGANMPLPCGTPRPRPSSQAAAVVEGGVAAYRPSDPVPCRNGAFDP
jgi:asparagine synthetase B (glutamine-hydrolysing)